MRYFWDTSGVDISWDMDASQRSNSSLHWQIVCIKPKIGVPPRSRVPQAHDPGELGQIWLILDDLSLWDFDHRELLLFLSQKLMSLLQTHLAHDEVLPDQFNLNTGNVLSYKWTPWPQKEPFVLKSFWLYCWTITPLVSELPTLSVNDAMMSCRFILMMVG